MDQNERFYTLKGYQRNAKFKLTPAMEDYLEMICRMLQNTDVVRIGELARALNVQPSSASKMIRHLMEQGFVDAPKYSYIRLTDAGRAEGEYLLYRHEVLLRFLRLICEEDNQLEQAEKIEHFFDRATIQNLDTLTRQLQP